ncbi:MAG: DUF488 domain-containing protein [Candidatus Dormibacteraceae bacterium]
MPERRVRLRRVYDHQASTGGAKTVLVDRVWPRGIKKENLPADLWLREVAPSTELRTWFGHRPERWQEFRERYLEELRGPGRAPLLDQLVDLARQGPVILLYSARDTERNQAVVIREAVEARLEEPS